MNHPFVPCIAGGKKLACTSLTARVDLPTNGETLVITNVTPDQPIWVELGTATVEAVKYTGMVIPVGSYRIIGRNLTQTHIAGVCDTGSAGTLYISAGYGGL